MKFISSTDFVFPNFAHFMNDPLIGDELRMKNKIKVLKKVSLRKTLTCQSLVSILYHKAMFSFEKRLDI